MNQNRIAVISTGNGGQSIAGYLSGKGYEVTLYAREQDRVDMFKSNIIQVSGQIESTSELNLISCNMKEVIRDAFLIMVTTPSRYHSVVAKEMAPYLVNDQMIVLNPGRTFGTYEFDRVLRSNGCTANVILAETDTLAFTCRCTEVGKPVVYSLKSNLYVAAHDPQLTNTAVNTLSKFFPCVKAAKSTLHTGFSNIGMVFHPIPILMNITRIEAKETFLFYIDGISPLVATILERIDNERLAVASACGIQVPSAYEWLNNHYGSTGSTLYERIQNTTAYKNIYAPTDIDTRYIYEDILTGCVPVSFAGRAAGCDTYIIDSVIQWASTIYHYNFYKYGRNEDLIDFTALLRDAGRIAAINKQSKHAQ
ncbi:MAG: NAD/NADP octopine/nopaline dehydrogenase family protein [Eubacteriales bacterium]|nr:NAD/NADP octopine/nopaline dehydrogenase family protein [Eubacteriales bacterium]